MHSKLTPMERLSARVSAKIEDGDVKGAVRLAASEDLIATYCQETVDVLLLHHSILQLKQQNHCSFVRQILQLPLRRSRQDQQEV